MATGTAVDVVMPQMGVSVAEGTITKWLKQEGEQVEADEPLLEISTDKVDTEVPSPGSGVLQQILVQEGETVDVGTKLAVIAPEGAEVEAPAPAAEEEPPPEPATQAAADESMAAASEGVGDVAPSAAPERPAAPAPSENGKTFVSPVVARIASEHGVDPNQVQGTGAGGRVTKKDILAFIESGPPAEAPAQPEPAPAAEPEPAPASAPAAAPRDGAPGPSPGRRPDPRAPGRRAARARPDPRRRDAVGAAAGGSPQTELIFSERLRSAARTHNMGGIRLSGATACAFSSPR